MRTLNYRNYNVTLLNFLALTVREKRNDMKDMHERYSFVKMYTTAYEWCMLKLLKLSQISLKATNLQRVCLVSSAFEETFMSSGM